MSAYISKAVRVGELMIGGGYPIRVQSMTNTDTLDTVATVNQSIRMIEAGCELVRITAQGVKEANNLLEIKKKLHSKGYRVPLIADIHFNTKAAEIAAAIVEKVRINPGNYVTEKLKTRGGSLPDGYLPEYTEDEYRKELDNIAGNLKPLIKICKEYGTAIRIGVNHGSLGNRVISRYGDTVEGMVESALEYARICEALNFNNLILSVKSSNTVVMLNAYRQLAIRLQKEGLNYPLHIGVTEAGDGKEGRMKSIAGIGAVLAHGIGDTIRVSLTEEPEHEIPIAAAIVKRFSGTGQDGIMERKIRRDLKIKSLMPEYKNDRQANQVPNVFVKTGNNYYSVTPEGKIKKLGLETYQTIFENIDESAFESLVNGLKLHPDKLVFLLLSAHHSITFIKKLRMAQCGNDVILSACVTNNSISEIIIENSIHPGALLLDGLGQGICIDAGNLSIREIAAIGYGILQATRSRLTKTEYIACPSCGRTHFNIQERLQEVKKATEGLAGIKIAVMGCIVNGIGEMADADYGYVGAGKGKVNLYKGKDLLKLSVPEERAVEELVQFININTRNSSEV